MHSTGEQKVQSSYVSSLPPPRPASPTGHGPQPTPEGQTWYNILTSLSPEVHSPPEDSLLGSCLLQVWTNVSMMIVSYRVVSQR